MELLIITGQSGAGKSNAVACLEDMGYYCIDNLPPAMIVDFLEYLKKDPAIENVAIVADIRGRHFFSELDAALSKLKEEGISHKIIFLEADSSVLLRRFQETRRIHPLDDKGNIEAAIQAENAVLENVRGNADYIINTSDMKAAQLYSSIRNYLGTDGQSQFKVQIESFGFKYGMPQDADWMMDVRFIPNPYYVESLKNLTGKTEEVKDYVLGFKETKSFIDKTVKIIEDIIPSYIREGKMNLHICVGCTGGKHRSVVIAERLAEKLGKNGFSVNLKHREIG